MDRQEEDAADRRYLTLVEDVYRYIKRHPGCTKRSMAGNISLAGSGAMLTDVLRKLIADGRVGCHRQTYDVLK